MAETTESGSICSLAKFKPREGPGSPHFRLVPLGGHSMRMGVWTKQSCGHSACPHARFTMAWCHRLFDHISGMCKLDFHPLALSVLRFWLQEESVMVRTTPGDVLSCRVPATSWVRTRSLLVTEYSQGPVIAHQSKPRQKSYLLDFQIPATAPWRCKMWAEKSRGGAGVTATHSRCRISAGSSTLLLLQVEGILHSCLLVVHCLMLCLAVFLTCLHLQVSSFSCSPWQSRLCPSWGSFSEGCWRAWEREPGLGEAAGPWKNLLSPSRHPSTCQESVYLSRTDKIVRKVIK